MGTTVRWRCSFKLWINICYILWENNNLVYEKNSLKFWFKIISGVWWSFWGYRFIIYVWQNSKHCLRHYSFIIYWHIQENFNWIPIIHLSHVKYQRKNGVTRLGFVSHPHHGYCARLRLIDKAPWLLQLHGENVQ